MLSLFLMVCAGCAAQAAPNLKLVQVSESVYSAIGATLPPSYENWGHNNNLSFVIGAQAVLVVNGGDNYALASALHQEIRRITNVPVTWVVNENGQGHAFLGNSYWREQGVRIIAHEDAVHEIEERGVAVLAAMLERNQERGQGTFVAVPDESFRDSRAMDLGRLRIELRSFGKAHSPGDISVWIPGQQILIAGDIAFHERLLGVFPDTDVTAWVKSFEVMAALQPKTVIPGHGHPTTLAEIQWATYDYLRYLIAQVTELLDSDAGLAEAYKIDQSAYAHLNTFEELAVKNAGRVFQALELEYF
ncbi:MAG: MBL fold metallo-hydrolase [Pseudomonadales bacterium]